jgi:hypothetical protein
MSVSFQNIRFSAQHKSPEKECFFNTIKEDQKETLLSNITKNNERFRVLALKLAQMRQDFGSDIITEVLKAKFSQLCCALPNCRILESSVISHTYDDENELNIQLGTNIQLTLYYDTCSKEDLIYEAYLRIKDNGRVSIKNGTIAQVAEMLEKYYEEG